MRLQGTNVALEGPSLGVAAGLVIGLGAVVLSRLTGVATPAILAGAVAIAWLGVLTVVVSRTLAGVDPDGRGAAGRRDERLGDATTAPDEREVHTDSSPLPDGPSWLESDETPWLGSDGETVSDSEGDAKRSVAESDGLGSTSDPDEGEEPPAVESVDGDDRSRS